LVEPLRGLARLGIVVDWSLARKSLFTSVVVLGLVLYSTFLLHIAHGRLDLLPFLDPQVLEKQIELSYLTIGAWVVLGLVSALLVRSHPESNFFRFAPVQLYAITNSIYAYLFGYFTDPYGFVTLVGGILVGLPLFGGIATRAGVISWLSVFGVLVFLQQIGEIPYGPLYKSSPIVDGKLSLAWALGIGSINVTGGLLTAVLSFSMFSQLRRSDGLLRQNQVELLTTVDELSKTTDALEEGRRELELRVEERTLELKVSNRNLQFEIEEREKTVAELINIRSAMEAAIEGVAHVSAEGTILSANPAFLAMHSVRAPELIGSPANSWIDPNGRAQVMKELLDLKTGGKAEVSIRGLRPDGTSFAQFLALVRILGGRPGEHYRFARDVTRQNELSDQLNHAMKMEAIGRLAGGVAHDFNNLLMAILAASERLQAIFRASSPQGEELEMADMIAMAGTRAAALTSQLLDFAHVQPPKTSRIDVNQSVRNALELLAPALAEAIHVEADLCSELLFSSGDSSRFDSGLLNVCLNAKDAMPEGGRLSVITREVTLNLEESTFVGFQPREARHARIDVIDDGVGMDAATKSQVFDPFFTTKPAGKGTGLGLSVFGTYVREVGGALKITSSPGQGTTCSIYIPITDQFAQSDKKPLLASEKVASETILLAEDEDIVARATTMLLSHAGYEVIRCETGQEAVDIYRERMDEIDLILLDYRMPVMTGAQAFRELKKFDPEVRAILMSGNLSRPEFADLAAEGIRSILRKPCSRIELNAAIREALKDAQPST
jgi:PAS domain S-box-containing protein